MKVYFSAEYTAAKYSFDTTRKSRDVALSLFDRPIDGVKLVKPKRLSSKQLLLAHDANYVNAVLTGEPKDLAESQGFSWDPGLWTSVTASSAGMVRSALEALQTGVAGTLSSGLHHARRDLGAGFCTFNGLALAAKYALREPGVERVLIVDFDAHCGGGTESIVRANDRIIQVDVATDDFDAYQSTPTAQLKLVDNPDRYLSECGAALSRADRLGSYDLVLYNAGMDPHEDCIVGGLQGITREILAARERLVFQWAALRGHPIAFALAGGYSSALLPVDDLVDLHRLTILAAAEHAALATV